MPTTPRLSLILTALAAVCLCGRAPAAVDAAPDAPAIAAHVPIGVNIETAKDYARTYVFADLVKTARHFGTAKAPWDEKASVDADGWPTEDFGAVLVTGGAGLQGTYKLSCKGRAHVYPVASNGVRVEHEAYDRGSNTTTADVIISKDTHDVFMAFTGTDHGVKNLKILRPGCAPDAEFNPVFLKAIAPFDVIRTMDWTATNNNPVATWDDRAKPTDAVQSTDKGVCWEYVIDLANQAHKDLWINIPDQADDDYVQHLAELFKQRLDPDRKVYLEYSNEVWNYSFKQAGRNHDAAKKEVAEGKGDYNADGDKNDYYWAMKRVAKKLVGISNTFRGVFGDAAMMSRIRPVLAGQIGNVTFFSLQLAYIRRVDGPPAKFIYGIAGAPYMSLPAELSGKSDLSVDQAIAAFKKSSFDFGTVWRNDLTIAATYGIKSLCYEGGMAADGEASLATKIKAIDDPRVKPILLDFFKRWYQSGGGLFCYYSLCSPYTRYGTWGLTDDLSQDNPKLDALRDVAAMAPPKQDAGFAVPGTIPAIKCQIRHGGNIYKDDTGGCLGSLHDGDTFDYLLNVSADGDYALTLGVGSTMHGKMDVLLDGAKVGEVTTTPTGDWQKWEDRGKLPLKLEAGLHTLRIKMTKASVNLKTLKIAKAAG